MVIMLFDTNIYGAIASAPDYQRLAHSIALAPITVLNFALVRDELRRTSRRATVGTARLRPRLLVVYDQIVARRRIALDRRTKDLADGYYREYRRLGGHVGKKRIINDFRIVACAALHGCDVVVSNDNRTMRSDKAMRAFGPVSVRSNVRPPRFMSFEELLRALAMS